MTTPGVLVVDGVAALTRALAINLRARGWDLEAAARRHPDVVVLDLGLPDMSGLEVIAGLRGWTGTCWFPPSPCCPFS